MLQGVFGSAFQVSLCTWCMHKTGPVFVCMFKPLGVVIAFASGVIFFGDTFFLGRLGFYLFCYSSHLKSFVVIGNLSRGTYFSIFVHFSFPLVLCVKIKEVSQHTNLMQISWINCNCRWVLFCYVGKSQRVTD